ncbi:MAG TPA: hypothetical protein VI029_16275 [Mycobacterium sp.]
MRAITLSLKVIRHDAIASKMLASPAAGGVDASLLQSPPLAAMAALGGLTVDDPVETGWVVGVARFAVPADRRRCGRGGVGVRRIAPAFAMKQHLTYIVGMCS